VRRLFSTFAHGAPGVGLLLLRAACGTALGVHAAATLLSSAGFASTVLHAIGAGAGVLVLVGLWTPIAGTLAALYAAYEAFVSPVDAGFLVIVAALAAALALLGPGAWSIDARLFGWKRIEIRNDSDRPTS
jgi:putative oxidoreductase